MPRWLMSSKLWRVGISNFDEILNSVEEKQFLLRESKYWCWVQRTFSYDMAFVSKRNCL